MFDSIKWYLLIGGIVLIVVLLTVVIIVKCRKPKQNKTFPELLSALGGKDNISNLTLNGSRISLNFNDKQLVDKEKIKENGVESIVVTNKKITLVIGKSSSIIYSYLQDSIK